MESKRVKREPVEDVGEEDMEAEPSCNTVSATYDRSQLPDLLRVYYTWLFPYDKFYNWLHYGMIAGASLQSLCLQWETSCLGLFLLL